MQTLTLTRPDDWHLHLRDGEAMQAVVGHSAERFGRAVIMPNLRPPVTTVALASEYRERILTAVPEGLTLEPLMTLYLTDTLSPAEIDRAAASGWLKAVKLYPAGATTNSDAGVTNLRGCYATLERMQKHGIPLLLHGEVVDHEVDVFDRERVFIDQVLSPLLADLPELRVIFEHITTQEAAECVQAGSANLAATITPHHLLYNRNAMLVGGIKPHFYCLPVIKREKHRLALLKAATSGNPKFFLGTDSAPHAVGDKESACGCAGIYSAHAAIEFYAEAFESVQALDKLEGFASFYGADFYRLPRNKDQITLGKEPNPIPERFDFGAGKSVLPLASGTSLSWRLQG
ncbi:MAG: dihydroorotase [Gammaproteobacteria bacterium]|nr:dihydroorotase [Gammaproteobacteria bacterium]